MGLDIGITNTDCVYTDASEQRHYFSVPRLENAKQVLQQALQRAALSPECVAVTGVGAHSLPDSLESLKLQRVSEFAAIGRGAQLLMNDDAPCLVVSAGSGTAMVLAEGSHYKHLGGSGLGGGTVMGLSRLLLNEDDSEQLNALAEQGDKQKVDLSIGDVFGGDLGQLPSDYTAVNFGKLLGEHSTAAREDIAAALLVLAAEVVAVLSTAQARAERVQRIVVVGNMTRSQYWCKALERIVTGFGYQLSIPDSAGQAAALGALESIV